MGAISEPKIGEGEPFWTKARICSRLMRPMKRAVCTAPALLRRLPSRHKFLNFWIQFDLDPLLPAGPQPPHRSPIAIANTLYW